MKIKSLIVAVSMTAAGASPAFAGTGVLDFLDGCAKARTEATDRKASASAQLVNLRHQAITDEYRKEYLFQRAKAALEKDFDEQAATLFPGVKFTAEQKTEATKRQMLKELSKATPLQLQALDKLATANYQNELNGVKTQIDRQHAEVHDACPIGVGDQVARGAVAVVLAPVTIVRGNIAAMDREGGVVAKAVRVIGISVRDIEQHGIFGGPNSIFRKPFG